jgi:hypothetical protein
MGRKITVGVVPGGIGQLSVDTNTVTTVDINANLTLTTDGTGTIQILKSANMSSGTNLTINGQGDLRLGDSTTNYVAVQAPSSVTTYTITLPAAVAVADNSVLQSNTSGVTTWATPKTFTYTTQTTAFNAVAFGGYFVNTSSGGITATLPSSPTVGDSIRFLDVAKTFDSNAFTVARNGQLIQGDAENLTVTSESAAFELIYSGGTFGWRIFSI